MCKKCRIESGETEPLAWPKRVQRHKVVDEWPADDAVVARLLAGDEVRARGCEYEAAIEQLERYKYSAAQIAARLRISQRTVVRYRSKRKAA